MVLKRSKACHSIFSSLATHSLSPQICKAETLVQARKRKRTSIENRVRGNLENMFLQCPKPTLQQISHIAQQLGLEKDVSALSLCPPVSSPVTTSLSLALPLVLQPL